MQASLIKPCLWGCILCSLCHVDIYLYRPEMICSSTTIKQMQSMLNIELQNLNPAVYHLKAMVLKDCI